MQRTLSGDVVSDWFSIVSAEPAALDDFRTRHRYEQRIGSQQLFSAAAGFRARTNALMIRPSTCAMVASSVHQMPGTNRLVRAEYAVYSAPNCSVIIFSSAPRRSARRTAKAIPFEKPATQFGITRA